MGRKITGHLNGGWITEIISRLAIAHSFESKEWAFLLHDHKDYPQKIIYPYSPLDKMIIYPIYGKENYLSLFSP